MSISEQTVALGEIAKVTKLAGFEYTKYFDYSIGGEVVALRSLNIRRGRLDLSEVHTIPKHVSDGLPRSKLHKGDIVLGYVGSQLGNLAMIPEDDRFHLAPNVALIRPKSGISSDYVLQFMQGPLYQNVLWTLASSTGQPALSMANIRLSKIWLPPLAEQEKIAEILSTWDKSIETAEKLLANAERQKRSLMQQLLTGKRRLQGFSGPWVRRSLAEISTRIQRKTDGGTHPILTISSTKGFVRQDEKYGRYMAGKSVENYVLLQRGEFAYNKGNSKTFEFGCVFDLDQFPSGLVPHVYVCFRLKEGLSRRFYKALFAADYLRPQLGRLVNTGVRNNGLLNISPSAFMTTQVPVPQYAEQEALGAILEEASALEHKLSADLELLRLEKSALMQQLLTGKRRVTV